MSMRNVRYFAYFVANKICLEKEDNLKLVSKELNHFGVIAAFFRDWAPGALPGGGVPGKNLRKTLQSPQSDLTPWTLTLG